MAGCFSPARCGNSMQAEDDEDSNISRERRARQELARGAARGAIAEKYSFGKTLGTSESGPTPGHPLSAQAGRTVCRC